MPLPTVALLPLLWRRPRSRRQLRMRGDGGIARQPLEEALRVVASRLFKGKDKETCTLDQTRKLSPAQMKDLKALLNTAQ